MDVHGGNIYKLMREGKTNILDYSSNINPLGVPKTLEVEITKNMDILTRYPDINYVNLRENIGKYNKVSRGNIIVGNGATEVLFLYIKVLSPKKTLIVAPTFIEYERALKNVGCQVDFYELKEENNFDLDIENFIEEAKNYDLIIICNPNNPTGNFLQKDKLKFINENLERNNTKIFIDECFIEFIEEWEEKTVAEFKSKNIFILRALTKFFALPGIRLGYGISFDDEIIKKINEIREPWSVNAFADLASTVILEDKKYIEETRKWIKEERNYFYNELKKIKEIKVFSTFSNFILIKLMNMTSEEFTEKMREKEILVRNTSNFKFLGNKFIRLAIKDREKNDRVIKTIKEVIK